LSSIGPHILGNSAHVVAAATTAVGVGSTVFTVTSTVMARSIRRSRDQHVTIRRSPLRYPTLTGARGGRVPRRCGHPVAPGDIQKQGLAPRCYRPAARRPGGQGRHGHGHRPEACACRRTDTASLTAITALTSVYCSGGPARIPRACPPTGLLPRRHRLSGLARSVLVENQSRFVSLAAPPLLSGMSVSAISELGLCLARSRVAGDAGLTSGHMSGFLALSPLIEMRPDKAGAV
jgi:hypothetical protein